jgi:ubiquinone/menaquinone biosynthesis C-methylase UbiE
MEEKLQQIRDAQKESWNKSSQGWKKWDQLTMDFLKPMGEEIIRLIDPSGNDVVLDVAAGTGEPGLTIATLLGGGKVISTDLAEGMLEIARENAAKRGITNFETKVCDVSALPFEDNAFDAISCRFGFMFFPDMLVAAQEMVRVLKPGGRIAVSVWIAPERNFWFTGAMGVAGKHIEIQSPPPGAPSMFRCATPGQISSILRDAGLKNVAETEVQGKLRCGTAETYWDFASECVGPIVSALAKADDATREAIRKDVIDTVNQKYPGGSIAIDSGALVVFGEK